LQRTIPDLKSDEDFPPLASSTSCFSEKKMKWKIVPKSLWRNVEHNQFVKHKKYQREDTNVSIFKNT